MLVKVRLPASLPPLPSIPNIPSALRSPKLPSIPQLPKMHMVDSLANVDHTLSALPSSSTILASILALFLLMSVARIALGVVRYRMELRKNAMANRVMVSSSGVQSKEQQPPSDKQPSIPYASWFWGLVQFFPPSRLSSVPPPSFPNDKLPTMSAHSAIPRPSAQRVARQGGPAYERPLPALYERDVPVSMAKMIMSRHTFRRPTSRPPPARAATVQIQLIVHRRSQEQVAAVQPPQVIPPPSISSTSTASAIPTPSPSSALPPTQPLTVASALRSASASSSRPTPSIVIPSHAGLPKSPLYRPISRSPSPPSSASTSPTSPPMSVSPPRRTPSPTSPSTSPTRGVLEDVGQRIAERRESEIV